jgi:hypothetical protein
MPSQIYLPPTSTPLNKSHPLSNGLVFCAPLTETGGKLAYDHIRSRYGTLDNSTSINYSMASGSIIRNIVTAAGGSNARINWTTTGVPFTTSQLTYTVSCWIRTSSIATSSWFFQIGNASGAQTSMFRIVNSNPGSLTFRIYDGTNVAAPGTTIVANTWYHIVGVRDGNTVTLYVNGVLTTTAASSPGSFSAAGFTATQYLTVGGSADNSGNNFTGNVSAPMIWNRVLSGTEIRQLYSNPFCMFKSTSNNRMNGSIPTMTVNEQNRFYNYRSITIDKTKVTSTQTNFPVLISGTYSYLKTVANGGSVKSPSGYDICFFSDSALTTRLKWEIEKYDATTGEIVAWVNVPSVSSAVDTVIYMAYGNPFVNTDQSDKQGVWDSGYMGVWHLGNGTTLNALDSSVIGNNGTITGASVTTGNIDGAASLNGTTNYISGRLAKIPSVPLTISGWVYLTSTGVTATIAGNGSVSANAGINVKINPSNKPTLTLQSVADYDYSTLSALSVTTWYYVAVTINAALGNGIAYLGSAGTISSETQAIGTPSASVSNNFSIGASNSTDFFPGKLDEIRISNVVTTEYNNQYSPSTFYTVGSEVTYSPNNFFLFN